MIPPFDPVTGALPPGIHEATWAEVVDRFGFSARRTGLLHGMRNALLALAHAGCKRVYLGGSFVTAKVEPGDWDGCFEPAGVDFGRLDKNIVSKNTALMKLVIFGEIYAANHITRTGEVFFDFFQHDREGRQVGMVACDPATVESREEPL